MYREFYSDIFPQSLWLDNQAVSDIGLLNHSKAHGIYVWLI